MPIEFPLNEIFTQTFQGHPFSDAAWLFYVSAGNRDRINFFLKDNSSHNLVGGQIFEKSSYDSIPQLVKMYEHICNRFLFPENQDLGQFVDYLFSIAVWFSDPDNGPLNLPASDAKRFTFFTEPESQEAGRFLVQLHSEVQRQFRTVTEARNKNEFTDITDAHKFWNKQILKNKTFTKPAYERNLAKNLVGYEALNGAKEGYEHEKAIIPLLWDKISEVVTYM